MDGSQFDDLEHGRFFMCVSFVSEEGETIEALSQASPQLAKQFDIEFAFHGHFWQNSPERGLKARER